MFGKTETEYGIRFGSKDTWYGSKSERDSVIKRMRKNNKKKADSKNVPKEIQRTQKLSFRGKTKDKCEGGTCKRNGYCRKHAKDAAKGMGSLYDDKGRNKNTIRWDGERF